jgi:hypothetical protein
MDFAKDRGTTWRTNITPFLKGLGVGVLDPCNKASAVGHENVDNLELRAHIKERIQNTTGLLQSQWYNEYHRVMAEIVGVDLRMVDISDFIVAYINTDIHSCGTYDEIMMAVNQRKPIVICVEQGKVNSPPWIIGRCKHEMIFSTWDEVQQYITHIDQDEQVNTLNRWRFFNYNKVFDVKDE